MPETETPANDAKKHRSPAYPFISLLKAVERATALYRAERRHAAPVASATRAWGFSEKSSGGQQTVAALKQYGLLSDEGSGEMRRVRLTDLAFAVVLDEVPDSRERLKALATAALNPKLFAEMYGLWGTDLPSDETIRTFLRRDKGYNDEVLWPILKAYKETLSYARLGSSDKIGGAESEKADANLLIGEFVQWESQGSEHFQAPRKLVRVSDDGRFGFVEGEDTASGFPMEQLVKVDPPPPPPPTVGKAAVTLGGVTVQAAGTVGSAREVSSLPEGEAVLQWPQAISLESVDELEDWLALVIKKMRRRYAEPKARPDGEA